MDQPKEKYLTLKDIIDQERTHFSNIFIHDSRHRYYLISISKEDNSMEICYGDDQTHKVPIYPNHIDDLYIPLPFLSPNELKLLVKHNPKSLQGSFKS